MNRGSLVAGGNRIVIIGASMRPRFMNRGSLDDSPWLAHDPPSFNEAPIHESGKYTVADTFRRIAYCFNEAPIHESGKFCHRGFDTPFIRASMRPRFMNRGSLRVDARKNELVLGFNEAPIHESGKYRANVRSYVGFLRFNEAPIHESGK